MLEELVAKLLKIYGKKVHDGMLIALGIAATFSLLSNFTEHLDIYKDSLPFAVFIAGAFWYIYLYVQLGMLYQLSKFFRWIEGPFQSVEPQK